MPYQNYERWKTSPIEELPYLSIVIPAYNEEIRIIPTIGMIASYVSDQGFAWELIISDDGSKDNTVNLVEELGFANLHLVKAPKNEGKGSAVRRGMLAAKGKYILFDDADNSTPIEELNNVLKEITTDHTDIVIGSRALEGAEVANKSFFRKLLSRGLHWIVQNFFRIRVEDTQCGFKLFTQESAHALYKMQTIDGFAFDLEILYLADKFGYAIKEVPVSWVDAPGSKVDASQEVKRFLRDLVRIKLNDLRGFYKG